MSEARPTRLEELVGEAQRVLAICNACRYCEGYCAVFPALERRLAFDEGDVHYLANLCHNCGACFQACQYAPPHEFALNFPRVLSQVRKETYKKYAWPGFLAAAFEAEGAASGVVVAIALTAILAFMSIWAEPGTLGNAYSDAEGSFYAVLPHAAMAGLFGAVFALALVAIVAGVASFWADGGEGLAGAKPMGEATWDAASLRYLDGGGAGCTAPDARRAGMRRAFHQFAFLGFMLCFAATCVATIYHYVFAIRAPYPFWSLPVLLGTIGGLGMAAGSAGLLWLRRWRDPLLADETQSAMDTSFLLLLFAVAATGLALLALRETRAMGALLAVHLGFVLALFVTLPYGKFMHAPYRFAALVRYHLERRRPLPSIGSE
ncbi:MAG TPA: tricarballylate utilization 4Fe-4S protein TcuB [Usitatibacter sp.]|jgi:citrate/tricarballylate utilization protein|nr:tricarballylate utilization 4Fe-4S protein TcuB [Usitatibacter sp.]